MKTYKLLKKYPSLPLNWEVDMEVSQGYRGTWAVYSPCSGNYTDFRISKKEVENNSEFWQEIVKKNFEILSFTLPDSTVVTKKGNKYCTEKQSENNGIGLENQLLMLKQGHRKIHSVKRLSDSVVFTVGDKTTLGVITQIQLNNSSDRLWFDFSTCGGYSKDNYQTLKHSKQPLFTTEDKVQIFEGNLYTALFDNWVYLEQEAINNFILDNATLRFSTKETAEEYIFNNKPCLSITDIEEMFDDTSIYRYDQIKYLINKVKNKL